MVWMPAAVIVLIFLVLIRGIIGPTVMDRLIAISAITGKVSVIILLLSFLRNEYGFVDIAVVFMLCGFIGTLWILRNFIPNNRQIDGADLRGFEGVKEEGDSSD